MFFISTAFAPGEPTQVPLKQDTASTVHINVGFDKIQVRETNANLETLIQQQTAVNESFTSELSKLNNKLPDMTSSIYEAKFNAMEEELGISKTDYLGFVYKDLRLTNLINFLSFIFGVGIITWLFTNKNIKRGPDVVLKLSVGVLLVITLWLVKTSSIVVLSAIFNPTFRIAEHFLTLGR